MDKYYIDNDNDNDNNENIVLKIINSNKKYLLYTY